MMKPSTCNSKLHKGMMKISNPIAKGDGEKLTSHLLHRSRHLDTAVARERWRNLILHNRRTIIATIMNFGTPYFY